jgi:iron only hydrogenase large subunit-like protein
MTVLHAGEQRVHPVVQSASILKSSNSVSLSSGCITSAESVLITLQSHTEVLTFLESNENASLDSKHIPILSVAPQSLASLAASVASTSSSSPSPHQILRRIRAFCKDVLGFQFVFDTTFARHLALNEHVKEFDERRKASTASRPVEHGESHDQFLPMLASACPGWICYAEKTHAEMLPFISKTKSPQQVMGSLVKSWMGSQLGKL